MDYPTISLGIGKTVVELASERACRLRIVQGAMRRETLVTVYRDDNAGRVMRAGEIPELIDLFVELSGPEVAPPAHEEIAAVPPEPEPDPAIQNLASPAETEPSSSAAGGWIAAHARRRAPLFAESRPDLRPVAILKRGDAVRLELGSAPALANARGLIPVAIGGGAFYGYASAFGTQPPPTLASTHGDETRFLARSITASSEPADEPAMGFALERGACVALVGALVDGRLEVVTTDDRLAYLPADSLIAEPPPA